MAFRYAPPATVDDLAGRPARDGFLEDWHSGMLENFQREIVRSPAHQPSLLLGDHGCRDQWRSADHLERLSLVHRPEYSRRSDRALECGRPDRVGRPVNDEPAGSDAVPAAGRIL